MKIKKLTETATIPQYKTAKSAGMDLVPDLQEDYLLKAGEVKLFGTGIAIALHPDPDITWTMYLMPRSGLGHKHGIVLGNCIGVIDNDYRGEIKVSLWNRSDKDYLIKKGDSIAQGVVMPVVQAEFEVVDELPTTERGEGGFNSTGR